MQVTPLFGAGVAGKSFVVTRQRRLNCYYENRADGDTSRVVIYGTPGLKLKAQIAQPTSLPLRAILGVNETALYGVQGNNFLSLNPGAGPFFSGSINSIAGFASLATNPAASQVMLVDGQDGWIYQPGPNTFVKLSPTGTWWTPGAVTVTNVGGYFVAEIPGTGQFGASNVNDATTGSALQFGAAAAFPDIVRAVDNLQGNLLIFCNGHMEFWVPTSAPPPNLPFAPIQAATNQWGIAAVFSRAHIDNALIFLGKTTQGTRRVVRIDGYVATPISEEIDAIINMPGFVFADAVALAYQQDKHSFYQLTFPTMGRTFVFDTSTGIWNEASTGPSFGPYVRHSANLSTYWNGDTLLTDWRNGNLYTMDPTLFTDNGVPITREVITRHQLKSFNRFRVPLLYLDMETGVGISNGPGFNPHVSIEVSKDRGRTWLKPRIIALGKQGAYRTRIVARRWGMARSFTFRIRMTAPVKFVITDGAMRTKVKKGGTL